MRFGRGAQRARARVRACDGCSLWLQRGGGRRLALGGPTRGAGAG